jgi:hypothetical protein
MMSDAHTLHALVRNYVLGAALPTHIGKTPLLRWLSDVVWDQREFQPADLAVAIGVTTERSWIGEVATALSFRIEDGATQAAPS